MLFACYSSLVVSVAVLAWLLTLHPGTNFCFGGVSCGIGIYLAGEAIVISPPGLLLLFAYWEAIAGRRASLSLGTAGVPSGPAAEAEIPAPWVEAVRSSQEQVTRMRSEVDVAFVPLILGLLTLGGYIGEVVLAVLYPTGVSGLANLTPLLVAVPIMLLLVPLWFVCRRWINAYQSLLQAQVDQISRLEGEFFRRFAGVNQLG